MLAPTLVPGVLSVLPAVLICYLSGVVLYRLFLHPLARVPGPKAAALSNVWYARHVRDGRMLQLAKGMHRDYGPAVRVGPNEVWFDSKEAFRIVYGMRVDAAAE
jgi:hypothetical protein